MARVTTPDSGGQRRFLAEHRSLATVAVLIVVVLVAGAITWAVTSGATRAARTVTFQASTDTIENPERGWFDAADVLTQRDYGAAKADGVTLVRSYIELDAYRDGPLPKSVLTNLQQGLNAVRAAGLKVILRVAYNQGPYPDSKPDASLAVILEQIKQLAPVFRTNSDVISSFEAGYIGAWGEWHTSTHGLDTNAAAKKEIYTAIMAAYPANRSVAFRYPSDIRVLLPTASAATQARTGNHQDCFLASAPDDSGTWGRDGVHTVAQDKALIAKLGRSGIVGGETCGMSSRVNCPTATSETRLMHFTYLNRQFDSEVLAKLKADGCLTALADRLGYRFSVTSSTISTTASPGGDLQVRFGVRNSGDAHLVNARPVDLVLTSDGTSTIVRLKTDPRTWAAGTTTTVDERIALPKGMKAGTYAVSLWLPDAATALQSRPAYSVRFANVGTWNATTGRNDLTGVSVRVS